MFKPSISFFQKTIIFSFVFLFFSHTWAGIQITGTRVIFPGNKKEISVLLQNSGKRPALIQAWIENSQGEINADIPFLLTPPLARIESDQRAALRILHISDIALAEDRESLFWFNVKEIPEATKAENVLQFAVTSRLKLFFRPAKLAIKVEDAYAKLSWHISIKDQQLIIKAHNPTPYFITLASLKVNAHVNVPITAMIPPFSESLYVIEKTTLSVPQVHEISYQAINDYGVETQVITAAPTH